MPEFVAAMRQLRAWSGLTYRQVSRQAAAAGRSLPHNTLAAALGRDGLPREELLSDFAHACGLGEGEVAEWVEVRRLLAMSSVEPPDEVVTATPRHLPRRLNDFTGRAAEIVRLVKTADAGVVLIDAIDGMAGVGKTALAVHAAHELAGRYPDGQLYVNLHAHTPGRAPLEAADALATLLRTAGVGAESIPPTVEEAAALWRGVLAERRMVVVLDDAADGAQVRPLLPGTSGCRVMITSRRRLTDLDDVTVISLAVLTPAESVSLLTHIIGADRAAAEPEALAEVGALCGHLPLALRIAGARLLHRPAWTIAHLADRLRDQRGRLRELRIGDRGVEAAFTLSYEQLPGDQRRMFRLLGLVPGDDIDVFAAAALTGLSPAQAEDLLEALVDGHLVQQPAAGRFVLHDLLRRHARGLCAETDDDSDGRRALDRLSDYYRHATAAAAEHITPPGERPALPPLDAALPDLRDPERAVAWLEAEYANLVAIAVHAVAHGRPRHAVDLSALLWRHMDWYGHQRAKLTLHTSALRAAEQLEDTSAQANAHIVLGWAHWDMGSLDQGIAHADRALALAREIQDLTCQVRALNLRAVCAGHTRHPRALDDLRRALALARATDDATREGAVLHNMGLVCQEAGLLDRAMVHFGEAWSLGRRIGHVSTQAYVLSNIGEVYLMRGHIARARACCERALELNRQSTDRALETTILNCLAVMHRAMGDLPGALSHSERALAAAEGIGGKDYVLSLIDHGLTGQLLGRRREAGRQYAQAMHLSRIFKYPKGEGIASNALGELCLLAGAPARAVDHHRRALTRLRVNPYERARALTGIARALEATGRRRAARRYAGRAERLLSP
ncbi:tetratricopeptide repeat protein [Spongiactinospora sp. TRM90649]|uniref:ATP-binding protein n=1 Tax=Spongiactinospora sp. TRM90649 TaxID=3031114 RepID=UPI0023F8E430|nr:tetratricopeptide repeat protein [Spongiactinospora sp. TRM90649]MDF5759181.1 tetratricopeptide repeat protein [Spongiactinospora sp. TRM90649]